MFCDKILRKPQTLGEIYTFHIILRNPKNNQHNDDNESMMMMVMTVMVTVMMMMTATMSAIFVDHTICIMYVRTTNC